MNKIKNVMICVVFLHIVGNVSAQNSQPIELPYICASQQKTYRVDSPEDNIVYHWSVSGGVADKEIGNEIIVKWQDTDGEGTIAVFGEDAVTKCTSETAIYTLKIRKNPIAEFDNSYVCYGQPLKILSQGKAPFEIVYTIDGKEKNIKTSETEYSMPNEPGKYKLTKVIDSSCENEITKNNISEIMPELKPLKIETSF